MLAHAPEVIVSHFRTIATCGLLVLGLSVLASPGPDTAESPLDFGPLLKKHGLYLLDGRYWRYDPRDTRLHVSAHTSFEIHLMSKVAPLSKDEAPRVAALIRECVKGWPHWEELKHVSVVFHEPNEDGGYPRRAQLQDVYTCAWIGAGVGNDGQWTWSGEWRGESLVQAGREAE
jgi:hypothetical protein